jgi:hypothetical protein
MGTSWGRGGMMGGGVGFGIGPIGWVWGGPLSGGGAGGQAGDAEVVSGLEVEPEMGVGAEPVAEAQGGIAGDGAAASRFNLCLVDLSAGLLHQ